MWEATELSADDSKFISFLSTLEGKYGDGTTSQMWSSSNVLMEEDACAAGKIVRATKF